MKICSRCLKNKRLTSFYSRKTGKRLGEYYEKCIECMKKRGRDYYSKNQKRQLKLALLRRKKAYLLKRKFIDKIKNVPCADCKKRYSSYVMDFDHRSIDDKITDIGSMSSKNWSLERIKKEIEKCDVVCANCHRIRTYKNMLR